MPFSHTLSTQNPPNTNHTRPASSPTPLFFTHSPLLLLLSLSSSSLKTLLVISHPMAAFVLLLLLLSMAGNSSATWCVCKEGVSDTALQKTIDYACGAGADCGPTHQGAACFNPNTVRAHCNYAVNSYFQRKGQAVGSCDFAGTATVTTSDPSTAGCSYPSSASGTITTPGTTTTPTTTGGTPTINSPTGTSPLVTTPNNGVLGGVNNGLGPSGAGLNPDGSDGGVLLQPLSFMIITFFLVSVLPLV